jgi:hypothetical protein
MKLRALAARVHVVSREFGLTGSVLRSSNGMTKFVVSLDFEVLPSAISYAIGMPTRTPELEEGVE